MNVTVECKVCNVSNGAVEVVLATGREIWIPRKLIHEHEYDDEGYICAFTIDHWFAEKHNIQYR